MRGARGVVTLNSTVGLIALDLGRPLVCLGKAIFDRPGLTFQDGLDDFWSKATMPDKELFADFRRRLLKRSMINGDYYTPAGIRLAVANAIARFEGRWSGSRGNWGAGLVDWRGETGTARPAERRRRSSCKSWHIPFAKNGCIGRGPPVKIVRRAGGVPVVNEIYRECRQPAWRTRQRQADLSGEFECCRTDIVLRSSERVLAGICGLGERHSRPDRHSLTRNRLRFRASVFLFDGFPLAFADVEDAIDFYMRRCAQ